MAIDMLYSQRALLVCPFFRLSAVEGMAKLTRHARLHGGAGRHGIGLGASFHLIGEHLANLGAAGERGVDDEARAEESAGHRHFFVAREDAVVRAAQALLLRSAAG